jgi:archaeal flagellar protein FlaJ
MDWIKSYQNFNVPPGRYLLVYVAPLVAMGLLLGIVLNRLLSELNLLLLILVTVGPPVFMVWAALMVPKAATDRKRRQIDDNIHFYITNMGVLAAANLSPLRILENLASKKDYGALAEASEEITGLVKSWNMGFPEACRFVAERTPSEIFSDFLERFAYAVESGDDLMTFLRNEQKVVMTDYATQYEAQIYGVESLKDLYMSSMMSVIFLVVFGLISPLLTGMDPGNMVWGIAAMILLLEFVFVMLVIMRSPTDEVWSSGQERVGMRADLNKYFPGVLAVCLLAGVLAQNGFGLSPPMVIAAATTPLAILGYTAWNIEKNIHSKEQNYPAFIRSLGSSTSSRGGDVKDVLRRLSRHDFGPLTGDIRSLHRRINLRLDDNRSWARFAHETNSNLVEKFTGMFTEGIKSGGDAGTTGTIVSANVVRILGLRKHRQQSAASFRGMMFAMTAGMAGTLFIGVGLLKVLESLFAGTTQDVDQFGTGLFLSGFNVDVDALLAIVTLVMAAHVVLGAYMMVRVTGGSIIRMATYIPILTWIVALAWAGAEYALRTF